MKVKEKFLDLDINIERISYNGVDVAEIIEEARRLAHCALEDLSIYRQRNNIDQSEWELGYLEGEFCEFLDKIKD